MKNISIALNAVLIIAVGVLYYLHFSSSSPNSNQGSGASISSLNQKVVYIKSDSLFKHYAYLDDIRKQLESKSTKLNNEYRNRAQGLQNEFNDYQRNVGNLTLSQAKSIEENLGKKEQNLRIYEQSLAQELSNEEAKIQKELYDRVTAYLKEYGQNKGFKFVLKFDPTSDVLFASDSLDITTEVIDGLNNQYKEEKSGTGKADSTATKKK